MPGKNRVVWSEGLFLRPQHFQQQDRFTEHYVEHRAGSLRSYPWGFTELKINQDLLSVGKVAILAARGVFPDGTPFNIPEDDAAPAALDVLEGHRGALVYLALPVRQAGAPEVAPTNSEQAGLARYNIRELETRDTSGLSNSSAVLQVGSLRTRLLTDQDPRNEYACVGIAQIVECRADKRVLLEERYIPPLLDVQASQRVSGFVTELQGLLHHRAEALAARVSDAGKGVGEMADFLLLQLVNRHGPVMAHQAQGHLFHPEDFFRLMLELAGEIATFTSPTRRPARLPSYRHDDLRSALEPLMAALRDSLSMVMEQTAVPIALKEGAYSMRSGKVPDLSLLEKANFVLAVAAQLPADELQSRVPMLFKIGSSEEIAQLVNQQLPGIKIRPLPVAPRQIPFHAGNVYFELDRYGDLWAGLKKSGRIVIHVGGNFPGLAIELWAIKG